MWESLCVGGFALGVSGLAFRPARAAGWAWRNRLVTAGLVAGCLSAFALGLPDRNARDQGLYLFVITLGYGHLIGALVFARHRLSALRPRSVAPSLFWALLAVTMTNVFVLYAWAGRSTSAVFVPLLAVSVWHIAENDLELARAYRHGLRLGPIARGLPERVSAVGITALVVALALATLPPDDTRALLAGTGLEFAGTRVVRLVTAACGLLLLSRRSTGSGRMLGAVVIGMAALVPDRIPVTSGVGFGDVFSAVTLYHLVSWLVFSIDRMRAAEGEQAVSSMRWLLGVHLPPAAVCVALLGWPDPAAVPLQKVLFSPAIYLFWSVLHVAQTALTRRVPRGAPRRVRKGSN
jgi:hypothetical protein